MCVFIPQDVQACTGPQWGEAEVIDFLIPVSEQCVRVLQAHLL